MTDQLSEDLASLRIRRDDPPAPKPWGKVVVAVVLLAAVGAGYVLGKPMVEAKLFKTEVAVTEISSVSPAQGAIDVTSTGYVVPQLVAKVGAKVVGRISKVSVHEGEAVKAGQVLFELDPIDQKSALASAQARVASARARVSSAKANVAEIQLQWERQKKLVATGAAPASAAEDLGARVTALEEQVKATAAEVDAAQAEANALVVQLKNLTIASPIDGTALNKPAQIGDVVSPNQPLVELADFSSLLVESDVPEARLSLVKAGGPCEVVLDSAPNKRLRGTVVEVSPRLNRAKATATVKVKLVDDAERLRPEMSARVSFLQKALDPAEMKEPPRTIVPTAAVVDRAGGKAVFVVDGGKVRLVTVSLGAPFAGGVELKSGPPPGTRVVKDPPAKLEDGQSVKEGSS